MDTWGGDGGVVLTWTASFSELFSSLLGQRVGVDEGDDDTDEDLVLGSGLRLFR